MSTNNTSSSKVFMKPIPLTEVMQVMHEDVLNFQDILKNDKSAEVVQEILETLGDYHIDERLPENITTFILEMVANGKDYSPESLCSELTTLVSSLEDAITSEQHKENVEFVRTILHVIAKHADEVTHWLEAEIQ